MLRSNYGFGILKILTFYFTVFPKRRKVHEVSSPCTIHNQSTNLKIIIIIYTHLVYWQSNDKMNLLTVQRYGVNQL